jgi:hypothetical protein
MPPRQCHPSLTTGQNEQGQRAEQSRGRSDESLEKKKCNDQITLCQGVEPLMHGKLPTVCPDPCPIIIIIIIMILSIRTGKIQYFGPRARYVPHMPHNGSHWLSDSNVTGSKQRGNEQAHRAKSTSYLKEEEKTQRMCRITLWQGVEPLMPDKLHKVDPNNDTSSSAPSP